MKILVIKLRNIGDVLLTTPLIKNLRIHYPDATIDMLVNEGTEEMVTLHPAINRVHIYPRNTAKNHSLFSRLKMEIDLWKVIKS